MWKRWNKDTHIWEKSVDNGLNWTVLPINASTLTEGVIADDRIPSNILRMDHYNSTNAIIAGRYFESYGVPNTQFMGGWTDIPFNAANFSAKAPMIWTVGAAAVIRNRYSLVGKTIFWSLYISWFSGSNAFSGSPSPEFYIQGLPANPLGAQLKAVDYVAGIANAPIIGGLIGEPTGSGLRFRKDPGVNFALTDVPGLIANMFFEVG